MRAFAEIPPQDVILGFASAVLLLLAVYFLVRSRWDRYLYEALDPAEIPLPSLFVEIGPDATSRRLSFVASLFLHLIAFALVPWLHLFLPGPLPLRYPQYAAVTLEYHIPLPPVIAPSEIPSGETEETESDAEQQDAEEHPDGDSTRPKLAPNQGRQQAAKLAAPQERRQQAKAALQVEREAADSAAQSPTETASQEGEASEEGSPDAAVAKAEPGELEQPEAVPPDPGAGPQRAPREVVKLLLPQVVEGNRALRDIVLQPDFTVPLPQDYVLKTPPVLLWNADSSRLENKVELKPAPGDGEPPSRLRLPEMEPQLQLPTDLPSVAELQMKQILPPLEEPKLPVPAGDVLPLSGRTPPLNAITEPPSMTGDDGRSSLVALSQDPDIYSPTFLLEPGLRLGSITTDPGSMPQGVKGGKEPPGTKVENLEAGLPAVTAGNQGQTSESGAQGGDSLASLAEVADDIGQIKQIRIAHGNPGSGSGATQVITLKPNPSAQKTGQERQETGSPEGAAAEGTSAEVSADEAGAPGPVGQEDGSESGRGRLKPLPRSQYGIILVSNAKTALPEATGVLTGNPIYTVYFNVPQAPRKWVLQYCTPNSSSPNLDLSGDVIRVLPRKKVIPPYALRKGPLLLPGAGRVGGGEGPQRVVVYATFDEEGRLENTRMIRGADPQTDQVILAALQSWEFLPAFRENEPVAVEAVFGIPLQ